MLRLLIGVITGLVCGALAAQFFTSIGAAMYPQPANFDVKDVKIVMAFYEKMPLAVRLLQLAGIGLGAFVGGFVANKIGDETGRRAATFVGFGFLLFQTMVLTFQSGHPTWYMFLTLAIIIPLAILGGRQVKMRSVE